MKTILEFMYGNKTIPVMEFIYSKHAADPNAIAKYSDKQLKNIGNEPINYKGINITSLPKQNGGGWWENICSAQERQETIYKLCNFINKANLGAYNIDKFEIYHNFGREPGCSFRVYMKNHASYDSYFTYDGKDTFKLWTYRHDTDTTDDERSDVSYIQKQLKKLC